MKTFLTLIAVIAVTALVYVFVLRDTDEAMRPVDTASLVTYTDSDYGISFQYPATWGAPRVLPGNKVCPEEDTYRTPESVNIFDREIIFPDRPLDSSRSFMRTGVRIYELDPAHQNACGDALFAGLADGSIDGRILSSVRLTPVDFAFAGYYNQEASRLNTEAREQFTLFALSKHPGKYIVMQPYTSFIPFAGSPELTEMQEVFMGDMLAYLESGTTSELIRAYRSRFRAMVETFAPAATAEAALSGGTYCYHRSHAATPAEPYAVEETITLKILGTAVTGTKSGTQSGPDMTNGYTGTLAGTRDADDITVVFDYTVEGSENKEQELYTWSADALVKHRYPLTEAGDMLVPDMNGTATEIGYEEIPCAP